MRPGDTDRVDGSHLVSTTVRQPGTTVRVLQVPEKPNFLHFSRLLNIPVCSKHLTLPN